MNFSDAAAMLTVDDDEFWVGVSPVEFGSLPALQDAVTVVGYPIGGDTISVTSGVVSRMEILSYVHGSTELLGLQVSNFLLNLLMSCLSIYCSSCLGFAFLNRVDLMSLSFLPNFNIIWLTILHHVLSILVL